MVKRIELQRTFLRHRWKTLAGVLLGGAFLWWAFSGDASSETAATFVARRGPLMISVLEGGSVEARESQEIRSEIKGHQGTKILSIVEEGYLVTEEDVKNGKILVELDSSELKERIITQDIQFQSTLASLTEARQAYEIQLNQNMSDIKAAEQQVRFALMDLEKFLGKKATHEILSKIGLQPEIILNQTNRLNTQLPSSKTTAAPQPVLFASNYSGPNDVASDAPSASWPTPGGRDNGGDASKPGLDLPPPADGPNTLVEIPTPAIPAVRGAVDFTQYANADLLEDGEAKQQIRRLEDELLLARTEKNLAQKKLEGTERLQKRDFVTKTELENERLARDKAVLREQTAETALSLYIKYEFPKLAEELLSKYEESLHALVRATKEARSKLAQAEARWRSAEGRYRIEDARQQELREQLEKCIIRAQKPGLVVYGGGGDRRFYSEEQIREGATVRERQPIITIPDMTQMSVRVKIPEANIKKVKKGMKALIQVDAFPDQMLTGVVSKVGVLPDSQDRWLNPDLKVYTTTINIEGVHDWVKPGMSARVEIQVKQLEDVVYIPVQAVTLVEGKHVCYVANGGKPEPRQVEIGEFNDQFIEIKQGLREGEVVLLKVPENLEPEIDSETGETEETDRPDSESSSPATTT